MPAEHGHWPNLGTLVVVDTPGDRPGADSTNVSAECAQVGCAERVFMQIWWDGEEYVVTVMGEHDCNADEDDADDRP